MRWIARLPLLLVIAALAAGAAGCGGADERAEAVEAREGNEFTLGDMHYRVLLFRELNVRTRPDDGYWQGPPPRAGHGYYGAFVEVCNRGEDPGAPSSEMHLEDAFGQAFRPLDAVDDDIAFEPRTLRPDECLPQERSVTDRAASGGLLVFEVPFSEAQERPFVLVVGGPGDSRTRVVLDL